MEVNKIFLNPRLIYGSKIIFNNLFKFYSFQLLYMYVFFLQSIFYSLQKKLNLYLEVFRNYSILKSESQSPLGFVHKLCLQEEGGR